MSKNIIIKDVLESRISIISNWIDTDIVRPIDKEENYMFEKCGLNKNDFHIVYAGNLGYAQNIDVILHAAEKLKNYNNDIKCTIFAKGLRKKNIRNRQKIHT